jgi:glucose/arabinose dehydrogenase
MMFSLLIACGAPQPPAQNSPTALPAVAAPTPDATPTIEFTPTVVPDATPVATAAPDTATPAVSAAFPPAIQLEPLADGFTRPVYVTHAGDGSGRLFVLEQPGRIAIVRAGEVVQQPFLDITNRVGSRGNEQGLLGLAFHPQYAENGLFFINYTNLSGDTVVSRFQASDDTADPNSELILLQIDQPYPNHNGGQVAFGPDGYLYIGTGDGGSAGDPLGAGQRLDTLLGKILRIDVNQGSPYAIPPDNPWASGEGGLPEIWAYGLRNPWRFSFDRSTGDLYIGDVGQNRLEEISFQRAGTPGGLNFGWNVAEGSDCFRAQECDTEGMVPPIAEYDHSKGCSVTSGYVYRGAEFPQLQGVYFFGDFCSRLIWALREGSDGSWMMAELLDSGAAISSFGEDEDGELYVTSLQDGTLYRVTAAVER